MVDSELNIRNTKDTKNKPLILKFVIKEFWTGKDESNFRWVSIGVLVRRHKNLQTSKISQLSGFNSLMRIQTVSVV